MKTLKLFLSFLYLSAAIAASAQAPSSLVGQVLVIDMTYGVGDMGAGTIVLSFVNSSNFVATESEGYTDAFYGSYTYSRSSYYETLSLDMFDLTDQTVFFELVFNNSTSGTFRATMENDGVSYGEGSFLTQLPAATPGVPALMSPNDVFDHPDIIEARPTLAWSQTLSASTWFRIFIQRNGSNYVDQWVQKNSWTPSADMPPGNYSWWVLGWNASGMGIWSREGQFTVLKSTVIFSETFEGAFPGNWAVGDANSSGTESYWGKVDSAFGGQGTHGGSYKGFCSGSNHDGTDANPYYFNYMSAYMNKDVDLSSSEGTILTFWYKLGVQEGIDWARVYVDEYLVWSSSVTESNWTKATVDLSGFWGSQWNLSFVFESDYAWAGGQGWYLDDITLTGFGGASGPPAAVPLSSPEPSAVVYERAPQFSWEQTTPASSWFHLTVTRNGTKFLDMWTQDSSYTHTNNLAAGSYAWAVQGWNADGLGAWSESWTFSIPVALPGQPAIIGPDATKLTSPIAQYTWSADANASWYEVSIMKNGTLFQDNWYSADQLSTSSKECWVFINNHGQGSYSWRVRGWSPDGMGPWSATASFTVPTMCPGTVSLWGPSGTMDNNNGYVYFSWMHQPSAAWYELCISKGGQIVCDQWSPADYYLISSAGVAQTNLSSGTYSWKVRAWGPDGMGAWSTPMSFTLRPNPPGTTALIAPSGTSYETNPTFQWNAASGAAWYYIYVQKGVSKYCDAWVQGTSWTATTAFTSGNYTWYVRAWNSDGYGQWSAGSSFTKISNQ